MQKKALLYRSYERRPTSPEPTVRDHIPASTIPARLDDWLMDCDGKQQSAKTNDLRRIVVEKLVWFLNAHGHTMCGERELRLMIHYLRHGHEADGCRWGQPRACKPARPSTVKTYHSHLCVFFKWLTARKDLTLSPMAAIEPPKVPRDQVQPFTDDHIYQLRAAAKQSSYPKRDDAILLLLLDTGMRASEVCSLRLADVDLDHRRASIIGKGNKRRTIVFGTRAARAVNDYLGHELTDDDLPGDIPLFVSDRGKHAGTGLTTSGLGQLFERLNDRARLQNVRCSPHTCRHTFAVNFLRAGGQVVVLQQILGHEDLKMVQRYIKLAAADIETMARQHSPMDRLGSRPTQKPTTRVAPRLPEPAQPEPSTTASTRFNLLEL